MREKSTIMLSLSALSMHELRDAHSVIRFSKIRCKNDLIKAIVIFEWVSKFVEHWNNQPSESTVFTSLVFLLIVFLALSEIFFKIGRGLY